MHKINGVLLFSLLTLFQVVHSGMQYSPESFDGWGFAPYPSSYRSYRSVLKGRHFVAGRVGELSFAANRGRGEGGTELDPTFKHVPRSVFFSCV